MAREVEYIKKYGKKTPIAWANLDEEGCCWVIAECPYCQQEHRHGAGHKHSDEGKAHGPGYNPREFLGHRQVMCEGGSQNFISSDAKKTNGYIICEDGYQ